MGHCHRRAERMWDHSGALGNPEAKGRCEWPEPMGFQRT